MNSQIDSLQCPKCHQFINKIVVMKCEHHICLQCAANYFITNKYHNQNYTNYQIVCEFCNNVTNIEEVTVNSLLDFIEQSSKNKKGLSNKKKTKQLKFNLDNSYAKQFLYCQTCKEAIHTLDDYLNSQHRMHIVKNIKDCQFFMPYLNDLKQNYNEKILTLFNKCKQKQSTLQFINDKKKIQQQKIGNTFNNLKRIVQQREIECLKIMDNLFSQEKQLLQKCIKDINEQIFKKEIKCNQINEIINHRNLQIIFGFVSKNKNIRVIQEFQQQIIDFQLDLTYKNLENSLHNFNFYLKQVQKFKQNIPTYISQNTSKISNFNNYSINNRSHINLYKQPIELPKQNHSGSKGKLIRSTTTLGPSLLKVQKMTPIQNLIETLDKKIKKNSQRLNIGSPKAQFKTSSNIRKIFSP